MRIRSLLIGALTVGVIVTEANAQTTFSVDFQGPTGGGRLDAFFAVAITEGDILTTALPGPPGPNPPLPGPLPPPGVEVGAPPGAFGIAPGGLGVLPGVFGCLEVDALSYGFDVGDSLYFSVDENATGFPGGPPPDVFSEGIAGAGEASADVFRYLGPLGPTPPGPGLGNIAHIDGDGLAPSGLPGVGLIEPNPPTPGALPDLGDNLDALDVDTAPISIGGPIYFSLDSAIPDLLEIAPANCGTAPGNGFSGADVLVTFPGGIPVPAIPAAALGLDLIGFDTDDLDALVFNDADGSSTLTAPDTIFFSVRRGSAVIGVPDSAFGIPIEEGDVLTAPPAPGLPPSIFIAAEVMNLGTVRSGTAGALGADELDALDLAPGPAPPPVPTGSSLSLSILTAFLVGTTWWCLSRRTDLPG